MPVLELASSELDAVAAALAEATGLSLAAGLRRALRSAVGGAAAALGIAPGELARRAAARDPVALDALVDHAGVGETSFFRHPEQLTAMGRLAFGAPGPLAIWSAGCASGEEPYSVAIALLAAGRAGRGDRILATDVSARALATARAARYGARSLRRLDRATAARFLEGPAPARVGEPVRTLVELRRHNLVADPLPGEFDVVLCRNVLIYFEPATASAVLSRLAAALRPGGYLLLGPVELPLASGLPLEWVEEGGATLLRRRPADRT